MTTAKNIEGCCGQGCDDHSNRIINAVDQKVAGKSLFTRFVKGYIEIVSSMSKAPHVDWIRKI